VKIVYDEPERFAAWAAEQLEMGGGFQPPYVVIGGADKDGNPVAACILNCYHNKYGDIEITTVGKGKYTRGFWGVILSYVWDYLGCNRVTMRMRATNYPVIKLVTHFGAKAEGRLRKYYGTEDAIIFGLLKEESRHVKPL
jgi:RimJ/RimL family protein N-acetyltransferase